MAGPWIELRCPCGPSKRGRFLLLYRRTVLVPAPPLNGDDAEEALRDLVIRCRFCKREHALQGTHALRDIVFARIGPTVGVPAGQREES